jgi:hypothetical protein
MPVEQGTIFKKSDNFTPDFPIFLATKDKFAKTGSSIDGA